MSGWTPTRRRLLGAVGAGGTAGIAGCGSPVSSGETPTETRESTVATEAATQAENWRQTHIETTERLAASETIRTGTDEQRQQYLQDERSELPEAVQQVHYVEFGDGLDVIITASTEPARVGEWLYLREAPWRNNDIDYGDDDLFVSRASVARETSLLSFVAPVETDEDGRFVLVVQVDLGVLGGALPTPDGGYTQIVDEEGRVIAISTGLEKLHRGAFPEYTWLPNELSILQDGLAGESGVVWGSEIDENTVVDLEEFRVGFAPVAGAEWVVFAHEPAANGGRL